MDKKDLKKYLKRIGIYKFSQLKEGSISKFCKFQKDKILQSNVNEEKKNYLLKRLDRSMRLLSHFSEEEIINILKYGNEETNNFEMESKKIIRDLQILGITRYSQITNGYLDKSYSNQRTKIIESKISSKQKNDLLIRLNKVKMNISKYSDLELINILHPDSNKYSEINKSFKSESVENQSDSTQLNESKVEKGWTWENASGTDKLALGYLIARLLRG